MKLFSYWRSSAAWRVRIALSFKGIPHGTIPVHLVRDGGQQHSESYRETNPQELVPALADDDRVFGQSLAIIEYLEETHPDPPLLPQDFAGRAIVRQMALGVACDIHPLQNLRVLNYLRGPLGQPDGPVAEWVRHWIGQGFRSLEELARRHGDGTKYLYSNGVIAGRPLPRSADVQRPALSSGSQAVSRARRDRRAPDDAAGLRDDAARGTTGRRMSDKRDQKPADPMAGIHWDLDKSISYSQYLQLDKVLTAQKPLSGQHDEMLFIVIHQASELWMKLCLHELAATRAQIRADDLEPAFKMLSRVARAQAQLIQSWDVLSTMTPADYMKFRDSLGQSSGFQSWQYRLLEFLLGNKESKLIEVHAKDKAAHALLKQELATPSLYDEALRMLSRRGFDIPKECTERDWTQPYVASAAVEAAWLAVYRDSTAHWDLYELAEKLVDLEYKFQQWRFAHLKTVERIIGFKRGTGGSSGVGYLEHVLKRGFFPELISLRTSI